MGGGTVPGRGNDCGEGGGANFFFFGAEMPGKTMNDGIHRGHSVNVEARGISEPPADQYSPSSSLSKKAHAKNTMGPNYLHTYFYYLGTRMSPKHRTAVTHGLLAGILLCNSGAFIRYFL